MELSDGSKYYVVKKKAVPEVLLKVVEAKRLLESEKVMTVNEATEVVGISRSSFYKYKDDIFHLPFASVNNLRSYILRETQFFKPKCYNHHARHVNNITYVPCTGLKEFLHYTTY